MKKTLSILVILTLLISLMPLVLAAAPPIPQPIRGKFLINGEGFPGFIVIVTNLRTGNTVSGDTNGQLVTEVNGFSFDLDDIPGGYIPPSAVYVGDTVRILVRGFEVHAVEFIVTETPFDVTISVDSSETFFVCSDGTTVTDPELCPAPEDPDPEVIFVCSDGSEVDDPSLCPIDEEEEEEEDVETKVTSSTGGESAVTEVFYGQPIDIILTNNKLIKLFEDEVYYDGEDYETKEEVYFKGIVLTSVDDEDYGLDTYLTFGEEDIEYRYVFEDLIPIEDFHIEEPLEINFLGKDIKIIEALATEVVIRSGEELFLKETDKAIVEGKELEVITIAENSVLISVDGIEKIISDQEDREVNGLHVLVENILYKNYEGGVSHVELIAGLETDETVKDGDDFELFVKDEEIWSWVIKLGAEPQYIGIINQETYNDIDDDEDYRPLGIGDSLVLPNDYLQIMYQSVTQEDMTDMDFKVKNKDGQEYLFVKGDNEDAFNFGSADFDRLYIDSTGIYDEDLEFITSDKIQIGDSDSFLEMGSTKIKDLRILLDLADIIFQGVSMATEDEDFMDHLGIIFKDPENAVEDREGFKVSVPEERPEALISFNAIIQIGIKPTPVEPEEETPTDTETTEPTTPEEETITEPVVVEKEVIKEVEVIKEIEVIKEVSIEEIDTLYDKIFSLALNILGAFGFGAGFLGIVNYYWRKGEKPRALKMLNTAIRKALLGEYIKFKKNNGKDNN